jgi:uncharacterized protein RhaS with RHS repeats
MRARYYDPYSQKFLSEDEYGVSSRDVNYYRYVFNQPLRFNDPFGFETSSMYPDEPFGLPSSIGYGAIGVAGPAAAVVIGDCLIYNKRKGERGKTGHERDSDDPFKKLKPDPDKPGNVLVKDPHSGKSVSKPAPPGFDDYWKGKK